MSGTFSLQDLLSIEDAHLGGRRHGVARWDARFKTSLVAITVLANVLLARPDLSFALLLLAWAGIAYSRVPWRPALWFVIAPAWATALVVIGYSIGFGVTPLGQWGPITFYHEGLLQGLAAGLRVLSEVSWVALLMLTTPFAKLMAALRWWRVPAILVDTLAYMYRYLFLLYDEFTACSTAARARGGYSTWGRSLATTGMILAHCFLRAMDRAERIEQAIKARGGWA